MPYFSIGTKPKDLKVGDRIYVVFNGKLRGYAPLLRLESAFPYEKKFYLVRGNGAVAVTIDEHIKGFRGFRYRWWAYSQEKPFPDWKIP